MEKLLLLISFMLVSLNSSAKLKIMTTTTNIKSIVDAIGGNQVDVTSFCRGTQDPHFLEAKPSYMMKASKADLLVSVGLELEIGWLPLVVRGARNPKLRVGQIGRLEIGDGIETLEKPLGQITRADGDVHPSGNPHVLLDPLNAVKVAKMILDKLIEIDSKNQGLYLKNYSSFKKLVENEMDKWKAIVPKGLKVITYHRTLSYFYKRFGITNIDILEPKPGVPPTVKHILKLLKNAKESNVKLILVENYFDSTVANRVAREVKGLKVKTIPVAVGGEKEIKSIIQLYDHLVKLVKK